MPGRPYYRNKFATMKITLKGARTIRAVREIEIILIVNSAERICHRWNDEDGYLETEWRKADEPWASDLDEDQNDDIEDALWKAWDETR